jgi:membrane protein involved in colicin uptake
MARRKGLLGAVVKGAAQGAAKAERERQAAAARQAKAAQAQAKKNARAEANQSIREARRYLAYMQEHGTPEQIQAAQEVLDEWLQYRDRL